MEKKKIDALGRIVLPKSILRHLHWKNGDELLLIEEGNSLRIEKADLSCMLCEGKSDLVLLKENIYLCEICLKNLLSS
ncbi:MAG: AbrB/MazE/SpoVT family DNA-binding domain-containing protein [Clostridia bacterium]|nr:AbrB/MazE/SpoVT family DNA-binding domain-containing protein [Clostridia bacterium]